MTSNIQIEFEVIYMYFISSYMVYDLVSDSHYMMSVNISVCYEPDNCTLTENILENGMFPKPVCDFGSADFEIPSKHLHFLKSRGAFYLILKQFN